MRVSVRPEKAYLKWLVALIVFLLVMGITFDEVAGGWLFQ